MYCQQISEFEFLTHFVGRKRKKRERRKKEGKQERVGGREGGKAGRETGRREGGGRKEKKICLPVQSGFYLRHTT